MLLVAFESLRNTFQIFRGLGVFSEDRTSAGLWGDIASADSDWDWDPAQTAAKITTSRRKGKMASGGEQRVSDGGKQAQFGCKPGFLQASDGGAASVDGAAPDTVQSLQHEIEVIKAKKAQEREKIKVT